MRVIYVAVQLGNGTMERIYRGENVMAANNLKWHRWVVSSCRPPYPIVPRTNTFVKLLDRSHAADQELEL